MELVCDVVSNHMFWKNVEFQKASPNDKNNRVVKYSGTTGTEISHFNTVFCNLVTYLNWQMLNGETGGQHKISL
jgi:hypothetical protein